MPRLNFVGHPVADVLQMHGELFVPRQTGMVYPESTNRPQAELSKFHSNPLLTHATKAPEASQI